MNGIRNSQMEAIAAQSNQARCACGSDGYCPTCIDEALPVTIQQINPAEWTAMVLLNGEISEVDISLIEEPAVGQVVLVHGGVAIGSVAAEDAP
jgi:hydrogenase assembly chaperone HypC/HupF